MSSNKKWNSDLIRGNKGERVIGNYFNENKGITDIQYNDDYRYDIKGEKDGKVISFEVKTDRYEYFKKITTGNMFIEVSCSNKPSGISNSQADYFIYYFPDQDIAYLISMGDLRLMLMKENLQMTEQSGDGGKVQGFIIHIQSFREYFKVIKIKKDLNIWTD